MPNPFVKFGNHVKIDDLKSTGIELDGSIGPSSMVRAQNSYEAPCSIKTSIRELNSVGAFSYINGRGRFSNVNIGRYCSIAESVSVGYPEHPTNWLSTSCLQYIKPHWMSRFNNWDKIQHQTLKITTIENDVWIGKGAFLGTGIKVSTGAIIGAHAVVTKDVPPYAVVAGNPAKIIKFRFEDTVIQQLLALRWWDFSPEQLNGCVFNDLGLSIEFITVLRKQGINTYNGIKLVISESGAILE